MKSFQCLHKIYSEIAILDVVTKCHIKFSHDNVVQDYFEPGQN